MPPFRLKKSQQLTHNLEYKRVYAARTSVVKGPLRIHGLPREQEGSVTRFGLSVPGRVGTNVKRNRIKRLIREAFRLGQHGLPMGLDLVVSVHPHDERTVDEYAAMVSSAAESLAKTWGARKGQTAKGQSDKAS